jgi:hypothetical protein
MTNPSKNPIDSCTDTKMRAQQIAGEMLIAVAATGTFNSAIGTVIGAAIRAAFAAVEGVSEETPQP